MKKKNHLLKYLPLHIRKKNSKFYINTLSGQLIHVSRILNHIPISPETALLKDEIIQQARWDLNLD